MFVSEFVNAKFYPYLVFACSIIQSIYLNLRYYLNVQFYN